MGRQAHLRTIWWLLAVLSLLAALLGPGQAAAAPEAQAPGGVQIETAVSQQIAESGSASFWIEFGQQVDLSAAYGMDWEQRGWYVYEQLTAAAERSQAEVRAQLDRLGVAYQAFWISNSIYVPDGGQALLNNVASRAGVAAIRAPRQVFLHEPTRPPQTQDSGILAVDSNIAHVNAPQAWALGYTGAGLVVANIDTGVRYTHQALVNQYRGNLGGGSFNHNYNWYDPNFPSYSYPYDDHGHGTHTMGTMLGNDGAANQIGMAPGAQWIACRGCATSNCTDAALLACAQFVAAPTNLAGSNPNPSLRAHVVNNSWGDCGWSYDPRYQSAVNAWHAAGIYPVFSNGNTSNCGYSAPPGLNTVGNPARYGNVTGVGSTGNSNGLYASHSNWGPTDNLDTVNPKPGFANMKPQVVAPGVNIRSAIPTSDSSYQSGWTGTSMSAPHVSGLVALMWQAGTCLIGNYAQTETLIEDTATPIVYDDLSALTPTNHPNFATGWGEIDALAAVTAARDYCIRIFLPFVRR